MERLSTGDKNLDAILGGGIPVFSVNVICGRPGTGKTVLTQQLAFYNATPERKALYLTTVSEPTVKVIRYQQQFRFFVPEKVGESVFFQDIGGVVREGSLEKTAETIVNIVKSMRPAIVVIDSFKAIHDVSPNTTELRKFVYDLAVKMAGWQCTTFLVGEYSSEQIETEPEFAVADGVIQLTYNPTMSHARRSLQVIKMRGTGYLDGQHSCVITDAGMAIFPCRLVVEDLPNIPDTHPTISFGLPELDAIFGGGLPIYSHLLVSGAAGTGKTIFSLQYAVYGAIQYQDPAVIFLYEESPGQLRHLAKSFGWDLEALEKEGQLRLVFSLISDLNLDVHLQQMMQTVQECQARRVVIDSLSGLLHPAAEDIFFISEKISELTCLLKKLGCTTLSTTRVGNSPSAISRYGVEESLVDGVVLLKTVATGTHRKRSLEVFKLRGANPLMDEHRLQITPTGLKVFYTPLYGVPNGERRTDV